MGDTPEGVNMKREILFRGKRIDNGEWVEGDLVHRNGKIYVFPQDGLNSADRYEVIPETVGQFITTLPNENRDKVFSNSILEIVSTVKGNRISVLEFEWTTRIDTAEIRFNTKRMQYELKVYHNGKYKRIANAGYFLNSSDTKVIGNKEEVIR